MAAQLKVTQIKSVISEKQNQRDTLRSLGLKRIGDSVVREPVGVCALITPWNWPLNQVVLKVIWVANKRFEISKFKFKFPRARTYEIIGLVLGCTSSGARPQARASGGTCPHSDNHAKGEVGPAHKHYAAIVCWQ